MQLLNNGLMKCLPKSYIFYGRNQHESQKSGKQYALLVFLLLPVGGYTLGATEEEEESEEKFNAITSRSEMPNDTVGNAANVIEGFRAMKKLLTR